ncbi:hypothetical protein ACNGTP_02165 [Bisgaard Taxon 45]
MLRDKVTGALFGQALGDTMGMSAELSGKKKARHYFGGFITEMLDGLAENDVATYLHFKKCKLFFYHFLIQTKGRKEDLRWALAHPTF